MIIRTIAAIAAAALLATGCSSGDTQPTPSTPATTTTVQETQAPDALKQLEDLEGKGYERIEGAPHPSANGGNFQTMLWMYGNDTRIEISNQFTADKRFEAVSLDIRMINDVGPFTFWCGTANPGDVSATVKAFEEAVKLMKVGGIKLIPTDKNELIAELPSPHKCWVQYI